MERYVAHLIGHPVAVYIECGCTRVISTTPEALLKRLGPAATIEDGERRMICKDCGQRPKLLPQGHWGVTGGRDRRQNPPPMPDWVDLS